MQEGVGACSKRINAKNKNPQAFLKEKMKRGGKLPLEKAQKGVCAGHCLQNGLDSHTAMWGTGQTTGTLRGMERKACLSSCCAPSFGSGACFLKASSADCGSDDGGPRVSPSSSLKKRGFANSCPDSHKTEKNSMDGWISRGLGRGGLLA